MNQSMNSMLSDSMISLTSTRAGGGWVLLDVAGKEFRTTKGSLLREPDSLLAQLVAEPQVDPGVINEQSEGRIFLSDNGDIWNIDSDQKVFEAVLKFLRTGKLLGKLSEGVSEEDVKQEAEFFRLPTLVNICDKRIQERANVLRSASFESISAPPVTTVPLQPPASLTSFVPQQFNNDPPPGIPTPLLVQPGRQPQQPQQQPQPMPVAPPPGFPAQPVDFLAATKSKFMLPSTLSPQTRAIHEAQTACLNSSSFSSSNHSLLHNQSQPFAEGVTAVESDECFAPTDTIQQQQQAKDGFDAAHLFRLRTQADEAEQEQEEVDPNFAEECIHSTANVFETLRPPSHQTHQWYQLVGSVVLNYESAYKQNSERLNKFMRILDQQPLPEQCHFERFHNLGAVLFALQQLYHRHPNGCSVEQYVNFENDQKRAQLTQDGFCFSNRQPTVVSLLHAGDDLLILDPSTHKLHVSEEVARTQLFCLGKNLCSNLYRLLRYRSPDNAIRVQTLIDEKAQTLGPKGSQKPGRDALLALCNRYPNIFRLKCFPQDHYRFDTAFILLNEQLVNNENISWRVVLDCDFAIGTGGDDFCNCNDCSAGA